MACNDINSNTHIFQREGDNCYPPSESSYGYWARSFSFSFSHNFFLGLGACLEQCDAIRKAQLHQLPPYLCFQLKRFVFDMKTFQRKKVKNLIKVPLKLDMSVFLNTSATDSTSGSGDRVDNEGEQKRD